MLFSAKLRPRAVRSTTVLLLCLLISAAIFLYDLTFPMGVNRTVLYVAIVVLTLWLPGYASTLIFSALAAVLTLAGLINKPISSDFINSEINRAFSLFAVLACAGLVIYRKRADTQRHKAIARASERQAAILSLALNRYVVEGELNDAARIVAETASRLFDVERSSIWFFEREGEYLRCLTLLERSSRKWSAGLELAAAKFPNYFTALKSGRVIDVEDALTDPRTNEYADSYLKPLNITSMLDSAIRVAGEVVGVLCVEQVGRQRKWDAGDLSFVAELADLLGQTLMNQKRRLSEEALRDSEKKYRDLVETSNDLIWAVDSTGRFTFLNRGATKRIYGYEPEEMLGRHFTDFVDPTLRDKDLKAFEEIKAGQPYFRYDTVHLRKDGTPVHLSFNAIFLRDENGEVRGTTGTASDITQIKLAQEKRDELEMQLRQSQKMEALGVLAGGIAHEFNNILSSIIGYGELLSIGVGENSVHRSNAEAVLIGAHRAKDLVRQILTFSRKSHSEKHPLAIIPVVEEVLRLIQVSLPQGVVVRRSFNGSPTILADANELYQLIMNLCTNAVFAMKDNGGELSLGIDSYARSELNNNKILGLVADEIVKITVSDTGTGIKAEHKERIFDPFFTTKALGRGTGLGLAVVHGIVSAHGGQIYVESTEGRGSTFEVYLPVLTQPNPVNQSKPILDGGRGMERILVVDDEEMISTLAKEMLTQYGYNVCACTNPNDAYSLLHEKSADYDLLITDLTMSPMTGIELIEKIRREGILIPAILCSGYGAGLASELSGVGELYQAKLAKPFTLRELLGTVRRVLDEAASCKSDQQQEVEQRLH